MYNIIHIMNAVCQMSESLPGDGSEAVLAAVKEDEETLVVKGHVKFFQRVLSVLPYGAKSLDVNRCSVCVCVVYVWVCVCVLQ